MIVLWMACGTRTPLVDEARELGRTEVAGRSFVWRASLRGWHHGLSFDPLDPHLAHDAVYVGWEVGAEGAMVRGEVDQTWDLPTVEDGRDRYGALTLETCTAEDRLAFRVTADGPWRILVPDRAGAGGGLAEGATCADALLWAGPAAVWRRDRAAHPATCTHLYRLGQPTDAIRCLLREPPRNGTGHTSRQDLARAADDPAFDARVLEVLAPEAEGDRSSFAPYRVRDLVSEVRDRDGLRDTARRTDPVAPWQAALVATHAEADLLPRVDGWLANPGPASDTSAELILAALADRAPEAEVRPRMVVAAGHAPIADCAPPDRPEPGRCAALRELGRDWLARHPPR